MANNLSTNALLSKTLALYGHRLTEEDYRNLLSKTYVQDIVTYLKQHKRYSHTMSGLDLQHLKRNQLEEILNKDLMALFSKPKSFAAHNRDFIDFMSLKMQTLEISNKLRHMLDNPNEFYTPISSPVIWSFFKFSQSEFCTADSYEDLLRCLAHMPIMKILEPYKNSQLTVSFVNRIDVQLKDFYYQTVLSKISRSYAKLERETLTQFYKMEAELFNISAIYRLKKFFGFTQTEIRKYLLTVDRRFSQTVEALLQTSDVSEFLPILKKSKYKNSFASLDQLETEITNVKFQTAKRYIHTSTSPMVVFTSFILLSKIEYENVIHLIEGIKYQVPVEEIESLLIY